ncbi:hypothetical protein BC937DRAFT_91812 [Endogone sp. FLAS-F59071]|nr:hypothetical protein BC937DRAFT_91812 [Endogone sp. FLAS-F59071]|eukprot:RUS15917.1 hypothetical protein BC937DRAFT_91812 [Endogone sp. FLAS-F59071]
MPIHIVFNTLNAQKYDWSIEHLVIILGSQVKKKKKNISLVHKCLPPLSSAALKPVAMPTTAGSIATTPSASPVTTTPRYNEFGALRVINEDIVQPGEGFGRDPHSEFEIFSYILSGELEHKDCDLQFTTSRHRYLPLGVYTTPPRTLPQALVQTIRTLSPPITLSTSRTSPSLIVSPTSSRPPIRTSTTRAPSGSTHVRVPAPAG